MSGSKAESRMLSCLVKKLTGKHTESCCCAEHNDTLVAGWHREGINKEEVNKEELDSQSDIA